MTNEAKKDLVPVFNILRSLVDARMPGLRTQKQAGANAFAEIQHRQNCAADLRSFADRCRSYDPKEAREAEQDADEYESCIPELRRKQAAGLVAGQQMGHGIKFYRIYNDVVTGPRIRALRQEYDILSERQSSLIDKMDACLIYHHPAYRSQQLCDDMDNDLAAYIAEYDQVKQKLSELKQAISDLEKSK